MTSNPLNSQSNSAILDANHTGAPKPIGIDALTPSRMQALLGAYAYIEFSPDGHIIDANDLFLTLMGYQLRELVGAHHALFCDESYVRTKEYMAFWKKLASGESLSDEFKRYRKDASEVWLKGSYLPVFDEKGIVVRVIKLAQDITQQKLQNAYYEGQIEAIQKSQAVIEFEMDGTVIGANENFLKATGYTLFDIQGNHHRMFCEFEYVNSPAYQRFWEKLRSGQFDSGIYKRLGKGGKAVWIQATYNPIHDSNGKPCRVVKFAIDITAAKEQQASLLQHIGESTKELNTCHQHLSLASKTLIEDAEVTSAELTACASASEEISSNVQSCVSATEEMEISIREIASHASDAARVSSTAVGVVDRTQTHINHLGESSNEITKVVKLIHSIAQQTNLLALNATIEAARAGHAGKGFAVVAQEVKELARRTAHATEEIGEKIGKIQTDTNDVVAGVQELRATINDVNSFSTSIASAVEEQSATCSEITRAMTMASVGTQQLTSSITKVLHLAERTTQGANQSEQNGNEMSRLAETSMKQLMEILK